MENSTLEKLPPHPTLSSSSSGRRSSISSPEFEFWMLRNPSNFPDSPTLLSADQLFSDGVLLPLHLLSQPSTKPPPDPNHHTPEPDPPNSPPKTSTLSSNILSSSNVTPSKRWKDIFKKIDKKNPTSKKEEKEKEKLKKKERKNSGTGGGSNGVSTAELNINIWPFSRSRSAGNGGARPRTVGPTRKVSSAPCSRSNSAGESKSSRKWPSSPSRVGGGVHLSRGSPVGGVHLSRSSPVWQVRPTVLRNVEKGVKKEGNNETRRSKPTTTAGGGSGDGVKGRVMNVNVPMCIGYRSRLSCRSDEDSAIRAAAALGGGIGVVGGQNGDGGGSVDGGRGGNLFNLRSLFTKKVY